MKRFTDTSKWTDPWFRRLSAPAKLLWFYILDHCDHVGITEIDLDLASLDCGVPIESKHVNEIGERVQMCESGKLIVPKFIKFQYGKLSTSCPPHKKVIESVKDLGLLERDGQFYYPKPTLALGYSKGINTLIYKEEDKDKEEEQEKEGRTNKRESRASKSKPESREDFNELFRELGLYPRDAEATWNKWEGNGWTNGGKKIVCWKSTVRAWKSSGYMPSQKTPTDYEADWPSAKPAEAKPAEEDLLAKFYRLREEEIRLAAGDHPDFDESPQETEPEEAGCF